MNIVRDSKFIGIRASLYSYLKVTSLFKSRKIGDPGILSRCIPEFAPGKSPGIHLLILRIIYKKAVACGSNRYRLFYSLRIKPGLVKMNGSAKEETMQAQRIITDTLKRTTIRPLSLRVLSFSA